MDAIHGFTPPSLQGAVYPLQVGHDHNHPAARRKELGQDREYLGGVLEMLHHPVGENQVEGSHLASIERRNIATGDLAIHMIQAQILSCQLASQFRIVQALHAVPKLFCEIDKPGGSSAADLQETQGPFRKHFLEEAVEAKIVVMSGVDGSRKRNLFE